MESFSLSTDARDTMKDITREVTAIIAASGISSGVCTVFVPHTTCGVTINEHADPAVCKDIIKELDKIVPFSDGYLHMEGNSAAHIKTLMTGNSVTVIVESCRPVLGTWQGIFLCEFDGPRRRTVYVQTIPAAT